MKVGTQQGDHQLGKSTNALTNLGQPVDNNNTHHIHCQRSESSISLAESHSDIDDRSESDFAYHNPPAVTKNQSISCQVMEASSNVKDQAVDEGTLDIFSDINRNNLVQKAQVQPYPISKMKWQNDPGRKSLGNLCW